MVSIAWWLSIPIIATVVAVVWVSWAGRSRPPANTHDTVHSYQRFRAAMEHDTFGGGQRPDGQVGRPSGPREAPGPGDRPDASG
jgi:hypothetical protein